MDKMETGVIKGLYRDPSRQTNKPTLGCLDPPG